MILGADAPVKSEGSSEEVFLRNLRESFPVAPVTDEADIELGEKLSDPMNVGGEGEVWSGRQNSLGRTVAIKIPHPNRVTDFLAQAERWALLDHPNIVPIYQVGHVVDGSIRRPALVMKLVDGKPWHLETPVTVDDAGGAVADSLHERLRIFLSVCEALDYAHGKGILHLDIKPDNILLGEYGEVYLSDWGISELKEAVSRCGRTPAYEAPEQAAEKKDLISEATDIYLLGGLLYQVLTGKAPHDGGRKQNLAASISSEHFPELRDIVAKATADNPRERFKTVRDLRTAVGDVASGRTRIDRAHVAIERAKKIFAALPNLTSEKDETPYALLADCEAEVTDALSHAPGYADALELREKIIRYRIKEAKRIGDVSLIETESRRLADRKEGEILLEEGRRDHERLVNHRRLRKRVTAGILSLFIIGSLAGGGAVVYRQRLIAHANEESVRAGLFTQVANLVSAEAALSQEYSRVLPPISSLFDRPQLDSAAEEHLRTLAQDHARLGKIREELSSIKGVTLPPEDPSLALASVTSLLAESHLTGSSAQTYEKVRAIAKFHPEVMEVQVALGVAAARAGKMTEATDLLLRAVNVIEERDGTEGESYLRLINLASAACTELGDDIEARRLIERSSALLEREWRNLSLQLSGQLLRTSQEQKAESITSSAVKLLPRDGDVVARLLWADTLEARATSLIDLDRLDEAEKVLEDAYAIRLKDEGAAHVDTLLNRTSLARVRSAQKKYAESEAIYLAILPQLPLNQGPRFSSQLTALENYSTTQQRMGKVAEAVPTLLQTIKVREEVQGHDHPLTAVGYANLSSAQLRLGKFEEAETSVRTAISILDKAEVRPEYRALIKSHNTLAALLGRKGDFEGAAAEFKEICHTLITSGKTNDASLRPALLGLANTSFRVGNPDRSWQLYRYLYALQVEKNDPDAIQQAFENALITYQDFAPELMVKHASTGTVMARWLVARHWSQDAPQSAQTVPRLIELDSILATLSQVKESGLPDASNFARHANALSRLVELQPDDRLVSRFLAPMRLKGVLLPIGDEPATKPLALEGGVATAALKSWLDEQGCLHSCTYDLIPSISSPEVDAVRLTPGEEVDLVDWLGR